MNGHRITVTPVESAVVLAWLDEVENGWKRDLAGWPTEVLADIAALP